MLAQQRPRMKRKSRKRMTAQKCTLGTTSTQRGEHDPQKVQGEDQHKGNIQGAAVELKALATLHEEMQEIDWSKEVLQHAGHEPVAVEVSLLAWGVVSVPSPSQVSYQEAPFIACVGHNKRR